VFSYLHGFIVKINHTTLTLNIPQTRYRTIDGSVPEVGDIVALDQGFTFPDGKPGCVVYGIGKDGSYRYEAEVYESEIGDDINT
jgi:hypothetical protein